MKCPACENELTAVTAGDVQVDVCSGGCGGVWFDGGEIEKFDAPHDLAPNEILNVPKAENITLNKGPRRCPHCPDEVMARQWFDIKDLVEINQCWECGGVWLDAGELTAIRSEFTSEEELKSAAENYYARCMQDHLAAIQASGKAQLAKYDEVTKNRFTTVLHELKLLFISGEDDLV